MNKKLRIAIIGSRGYPYVYSGYETLVKELAERLVLKGHCVRVYCHSSLFKKKPKIINGIELIYTPSIETKFLSQFVNSFFSFFHVCFSSIDIVLVLNSANGPFGILTKIFRKKTLINVDGLEWMRPKWKGLGSLYFKFSSKLVAIFYDRIITDSYEMNKIFKKIYRRDSYIIAYGSTMVQTKKKHILEKFNIKKREYYLIVGRLIPDNNSKLILNGFLKSNSSKKFVIVGDVLYRDMYAEQIKKLASNNVIFTGYINCQSELTQLYKYSYAYVHGHEFGGTNPTMINALHLNCNIIALDSIFNREMTKNKKVIFFKKNIKDIKEKFSEMEKTYEKIKKINSNYKLSEIYKWDGITDSYLNQFIDLISTAKNI